MNNATIKQQQKGILLTTKGWYMKESDSLVCNATIKQHQKGILQCTKGWYMKESNSLADNATIKHHQKEILIGTKKQFMKELSTLVGIVASNLLIGPIAQVTKEKYILLVTVQFDKKMLFNRLDKIRLD